jgi:hypothetical protein
MWAKVCCVVNSLPTAASQFPSEAEETIELDITPEQLAAKNEKVINLLK